MDKLIKWIQCAFETYYYVNSDAGYTSTKEEFENKIKEIKTKYYGNK
ncbi:MAG: hypothetical protein AABY22_23665 [Nanoarchaeota archaeon]